MLSLISAALTLLFDVLSRQFLPKPRLYVIVALGVNNAHEGMAADFALLRSITSAHPSYDAKYSKWFGTFDTQVLYGEKSKTKDLNPSKTGAPSKSVYPNEFESALQKITQEATQLDKILIVLMNCGAFCNIWWPLLVAPPGAHAQPPQISSRG
ncbi:hypothetical protein V5O48_007792 [Marasmius crinis-equi]|uniref:Uncharacterized protein n=1 Tax=Marasmius crinis-equi TaxID=585013 RepID=A0ABR3FGE8_9AGAR